MYRVDEKKCMSDEEVENEESLEEEDDWEGCCEDVLMDDEFYEREYCD
jgi:hypothetical protein